VSGQGENSQFSPVRPTEDPSGQILASIVQALCDGIKGGLEVLTSDVKFLLINKLNIPKKTAMVINMTINPMLFFITFFITNV